MRSLRAALLLLATALLPGCVVAAHSGYGYYSPGYARPYYGPPRGYYRPAPPPRYYYGPPRGHYRRW
jgi:hypothetical protein